MLEPSNEEVAKETQKNINQFDQQAGLQKKLENKSIQMHVKEEVNDQVGSKKAKKGKKVKADKDQANEGFQIDFAVIAWFSSA